MILSIQPAARALVLLWGGTMAVSTLRAQPAAAPVQKGSIEGRVVNSLSGEGLRKVSLTLTAMGGKSVSAQSDSNGGFAFRDLAPGGYRLSGERNGFLKQEHGARLNPGSGTVLALSPGQEIKDLTFKLAPNSIISGRVLDRDGEAMPNLVVNAYRSTYIRGKRQWAPSGGGQTNDRGEFRIANLRAGRYMVCANSLNLGIGLIGISKETLPEKPEPAYATTWYGNSTDMGRAVPVDVRMGEDHRATDIQMTKTTTVRVRGRVAGAPQGKVLMAMLVRKGSPAAGQMPGGVGIVQQTDGTFELRNVTPGSYVLTVNSPTEMMTSIAAPVPLEVADSHIEGIELRVGGGGTLSGRITISPDKPAKANNPSLAIEWVDFSLPNPPAVTAGDDGKFTVKGVFAGQYRLRVEEIPDDAYVKSVKLGGQEVDEAGVELGGGGELEIAVSRTGAQVEGLVLGPEDKPMAGAVVAFIPESTRDSHYRSATADHDGTFRVKGVPPGKYKIMAWEDIEPGAYRDPEFVKPFDGQAQTLALEENGRSKVTLKAIPSALR